MNAQIRRVMIVVLLMFVALMVAITNIQFFQVSKLNADGRNVRTMYNSYGRERGPLVVHGEPIASSVPAKDAYKFLRTYPGGPIYAPVTGYFSVAFNSSTGMEAASDSVLTGSSSSLFAQRIEDLFTGVPPRGGAVELTIDPDVQAAAWKGLAGRKGAVVALDPTTGAILALVSSPSFDPSVLATHDKEAARSAWSQLEKDPNRPLLNRAIAGDLYPPGSTFKIVTAAALLESGQATPETVVSAPAELTLPGTNHKLINNDSTTCGSGQVTLREAFARSCNTAFGAVGMGLGEATLKKKSTDFGFGSRLEIPLRTTPSVFPAGLDKSQTAFSAIGQFDVRATPLQMAMVAGAVANKGVEMKPYLVSRVLDARLQEQNATRPTELATPMNAQVAAQLTTMMLEVTAAPYGTGHAAQVPGVQVAGKSGTAQKGKGADAWFIGFAPADKPKIAFAVVVESENGAVLHGGPVAGPIAADLVKAALK